MERCPVCHAVGHKKEDCALFKDIQKHMHRWIEEMIDCPPQWKMVGVEIPPQCLFCSRPAVFNGIIGVLRGDAPLCEIHSNGANN